MKRGPIGESTFNFEKKTNIGYYERGNVLCHVESTLDFVKDLSVSNCIMQERAKEFECAPGMPWV